MRMVLSSVMLSPRPSSHTGSAATATTRSVSVGRLPGPAHSTHPADNSIQNTQNSPAIACWTTCDELSPRPALGRHQWQQSQQSDGEAPHLLQLQINTFTVYGYRQLQIVLCGYVGDMLLLTKYTRTGHISLKVSGGLFRASG